MPKYHLEMLKQIVNFLGLKVALLILLSLAIGALLYLTEYLFSLSILIFLTEIGVSNNLKNTLPAWFPQENGMVIFVAIGSIRTFLLALKNYLGGISNQAFLKHQRIIILKKALYFGANNSSHDILSLFSDTLGRASSAILDLTVTSTALVTTGLLLITGFIKTPLEISIGLFALTIVVAPTVIMNRHIRNYGNGLNRAWDNVNKIILEGIKYNFFFQANGLIEKEYQKGLHNISKYEESYDRFFFLSAIKNNIPNLFGLLIIVGVCAFSIRNYGSSGAVLLSFIYLFLRTAQGGAEILSSQNSFRFNYPALKNVYDYHQKHSGPEKKIMHASSTGSQLNFKELKLELKNVSFGYDQGKILNELNLKLEINDVVIIKGESGTGKSTLLSLLLGINIPDSGSIKVNDFDYYEELSSLRNYMSYAGPEPYLVAESIRNNLLLGHPNPEKISDEKIMEILTIVLMDKTINDLPEKLDYKFSEHANISTGQKQRIALARALIRDFQIIILDEATANLDLDVEGKVIENIQPLLKNKIAIITTHKTSFDHIRTKSLTLSRELSGGSKWSGS